MATLPKDNAAFNARILYWGIPQAGKRSSLEQVARKLRSDHRGELREVPTRIDPTVVYTVLPIELGDIGGIRTRIEIVSVPSDPQQAPTRKQLLDRADGIVFVVDSQRQSIDANLASLEELRKGLQAYARNLDDIPFIVQYNKRDLSDPYVIDELHRRLDVGNATVFESVATDGTGILQVLSTISKKVIRSLREASLSVGIERPPLDSAPPPPHALEVPPDVAPEPAPDFEPQFEPEPLLETDGNGPLIGTSEMEEAILAIEEHPDANAIAAEVQSAEALLEQPGFDEFPPSSSRGARIGEDMSIVSVGEATRADDRTVRVPIVLGDGEGETSTLVLTIQLDPLIGNAQD
jgi:signal recognition particle receptor subunit beta